VSDWAAVGALADGLGIGMLAVGGADRVQAANATAHELLQVRPQSLVGRSTIEVFVDHRMQALIRETRGGSVRRAEYEVQGKGSPTLEVTCSPDEGGTVLVALRDVSELLRLRRIRSEFIDNLSHELRTPLTTIRLLAESLGLEAERAELPQRVTDGIGRIDMETARLVQMVDELLDLATIEAGESPLNLAPSDMGTVVDETLERLRGYADHHQVTLRAESVPDSSARTVPADAARIGQILVNVIDNAIRYSPAGGEVVVSIQPAHSELVIEVRDQGEGIARADLERIFERFYKGDRARSTGRGGTGLGLAIARHIAERHGGRMWARSEPGRGAQLFLALPRS
jgi:two-component system phosphate regulon sensor histidine kinase PhoR